MSESQAARQEQMWSKVVAAASFEIIDIPMVTFDPRYRDAEDARHLITTIGVVGRAS